MNVEDLRRLGQTPAAPSAFTSGLAAASVAKANAHVARVRNMTVAGAGLAAAGVVAAVAFAMTSTGGQSAPPNSSGSEPAAVVPSEVVPSPDSSETPEASESPSAEPSPESAQPSESASATPSAIPSALPVEPILTPAPSTATTPSATLDGPPAPPPTATTTPAATSPTTPAPPQQPPAPLPGQPCDPSLVRAEYQASVTRMDGAVAHVVHSVRLWNDGPVSCVISGELSAGGVRAAGADAIGDVRHVSAEVAAQDYVTASVSYGLPSCSNNYDSVWLKIGNYGPWAWQISGSFCGTP